MEETDGQLPMEERTDGQPPEPDEDAPSLPGKELYEWLQLMLGCVLAAVILFSLLARIIVVDGSSMDNTLQHGELMLTWSLGYRPSRGDIVVLNKTAALTDSLLHSQAIVKRVVAVGGQSVDIDYASGTVYVDGAPLDEPYILETMYRPSGPYMQQTHWDVPEDSIFVLGDNRNASTDSRHDLVGPIHQDYILGKVVLALWPMDRFGPIP